MYMYMYMYIYTVCVQYRIPSMKMCNNYIYGLQIVFDNYIIGTLFTILVTSTSLITN